MINAKKARELTDTTLSSLDLDCLPFLDEQIQLAIGKGESNAIIDVIAEWSDTRRCHFVRVDDKIIKLSSVATALKMLGFEVSYEDNPQAVREGLMCSKSLYIGWKVE